MEFDVEGGAKFRVVIRRISLRSSRLGARTGFFEVEV
jgi:hypothetical protein